jgi:hypothetical protein
MLARRVTTILRAITLPETPDTTCIHRAASLTGDRTALVAARPLRAPYHTIADAGIIGGGQVVVRGDVSRSPHGALCPGELPACTRHVLEARSSEVMFRLRLLRRQDQIAEQPSHQPCQHDGPRPQVYRPPPAFHQQQRRKIQ